MKQTFILAILAVLLVSCQEEEEYTEKGKTDFLQYAFYEKNNPQSGSFWRKNAFRPLREVTHPDFGIVILAERKLDE